MLRGFGGMCSLDRDSILSREEIETLLSAIRAPEAPEPELAPVDFTRRLNSIQLEKLRELHRPLMEPVAAACKKWLNSPVQVRFLEPAESTPAELLGGRPPDSLLARAGDVLVDPSPEVAFALVERSLGGRRLSRPPDRPLRDLEAELITPALVEILSLLKAAWAGAASSDLRWGPSGELAREAWPDGSFALIVVEILTEGGTSCSRCPRPRSSP
jgi:flagellar motor switch protein FliM